jgi:hypothetical protein
MCCEAKFFKHQKECPTGDRKEKGKKSADHINEIEEGRGKKDDKENTTKGSVEVNLLFSVWWNVLSLSHSSRVSCTYKHRPHQHRRQPGADPIGRP